VKVKVKFYATIKKATGTSETLVDTKNGTIGDIIDTLIRNYGDAFRKEVLDPDGTIKPHVRVLLNGRFVDRVADPLKRPVSEGDTIFLFPPLAGG